MICNGLDTVAFLARNGIASDWLCLGLASPHPKRFSLLIAGKLQIAFYCIQFVI